MLVVLIVLALTSGASFTYYGYRVLFSEPLRGEFERYGMPRVRRFVGLMELLGGVGVLIGLGIAPLGAAAATGLALLMLLGLVVRVRIHDAPRLMMPAATLAAVNLALAGLFVLR